MYVEEQGNEGRRWKLHNDNDSTNMMVALNLLVGGWAMMVGIAQNMSLRGGGGFELHNVWMLGFGTKFLIKALKIVKTGTNNPTMPTTARTDH